jgi:hypothetical protein
MTTQPQEIAELEKRLERLEKQNRRMKQFGSLGLLLLSSVLAMAAVPQSPDAHFGTLEADKIIVRDHFGTKLTIEANSSVVPGVSLGITRNQDKELVFNLDSGEQTASLIFSVQNGSIIMGNSLPKGVSASKGPSFEITGEAPYILLKDSKKYSTIIGSASLYLADGTEINTTSGSIHLFNDRRKVIWKAP